MPGFIPSPLPGIIQNNPQTSDAQRLVMSFDILDPNGNSLSSVANFPLLLLHVNPDNFSKRYAPIITRGITRGGYVEYHWGDVLDEITASGSTGAFINTNVGLAAGKPRRASIAFAKYEDLIAVYRNNGMIYDDNGNIIFSGQIRILFDGNTYNGYFSTFAPVEEASQPFTFQLSWTFKVKTTTETVGR